jgi:predicted transcriptional regulator of viral defense system
MPNVLKNPVERARAVFLKHAGTMRTGEAIAAGVHPRTLYAMRDEGLLERVSRGVYRLAEVEPVGDPDLLIVAARAPDAVVCLISALALHGMTTQIPHAVDIALPPGKWAPVLDRPPIRVYRFSGKAMTEGIEERRIDGVTIRVYGPEKTLADCFKFRNKIGLDVAVEALRMYRREHRVNIPAITRYADIDRVTKVMRPYIEGIL